MNDDTGTGDARDRDGRMTGIPLLLFWLVFFALGVGFWWGVIAGVIKLLKYFH